MLRLGHRVETAAVLQLLSARVPDEVAVFAVLRRAVNDVRHQRAAGLDIGSTGGLLSVLSVGRVDASCPLTAWFWMPRDFSLDSIEGLETAWLSRSSFTRLL